MKGWRMTFINDCPGEERTWVTGSLELWERHLRRKGFDRIRLRRYEPVAFCRMQDEVMYDAIFAPTVIRHWRNAKLQIDGLIKLWTLMDGAPTDYGHWFADPTYYEFFWMGIRDQLRSIYVLCGDEREKADAAFWLLVAHVEEAALQRDTELAKQDAVAPDGYEEGAAAIKRGEITGKRRHLWRLDITAA